MCVGKDGKLSKVDGKKKKRFSTINLNKISFNFQIELLELIKMEGEKLTFHVQMKEMFEFYEFWRCYLQRGQFLSWLNPFQRWQL